MVNSSAKDVPPNGHLPTKCKEARESFNERSLRPGQSNKETLGLDHHAPFHRRLIIDATEVSSASRYYRFKR
jgi:hypothetical protein